MKVLVPSTFLVFSLLLFLSSGSPNPVGTAEEDRTSYAPSQDGVSLDNVIGIDNSGEGVLSEEEVEEGLGGFMEGRMVIQSNDYPGTGANNRHVPKPPTN